MSAAVGKNIIYVGDTYTTFCVKISSNSVRCLCYLYLKLGVKHLNSIPMSFFVPKFWDPLWILKTLVKDGHNLLKKEEEEEGRILPPTFAGSWRG